MRKLLDRFGGFIVAVIVSSFASAGAQTDQGAAALDASAVALYRMGKTSEAIPLAERAVAIREETLGPSDPSVATSLTNLAALYRAKAATPTPRRCSSVHWLFVNARSALPMTKSRNRLMVWLRYIKSKGATRKPNYFIDAN
jgi:Tetratricopeptide repeat